MLKVVKYDPAELQELAGRWHDLSWHVTHYNVSRRQVRWLYNARDQVILVFYVVACDGTTIQRPYFQSQVLMPSGQWLHMNTKGLKHKDHESQLKEMRAISHNLGLDHRTLERLWAHQRGTMSFLSKPTMRAGAQWNQWTSGIYGDSGFDYRAHFAAVRTEAPPYIMSDLQRFVRVERHQAYLNRHAFEWERTYVGIRETVREILRSLAHTHDCMDNIRVADADNRQHMHHYNRIKKRGCCGSYDELYNLPSGRYWIGFNYGH